MGETMGSKTRSWGSGQPVNVFEELKFILLTLWALFFSEAHGPPIVMVRKLLKLIVN